MNDIDFVNSKGEKLRTIGHLEILSKFFNLRYKIVGDYLHIKAVLKDGN